MPTDFTPDRGRAKRRPRFGYQATVEVWTVTGPDAYPAARLAITGWAWHKDQAHSAIKFEAQSTLARLGLTREDTGNWHLEPNVDAWWALDPKHVRNPDNNWVRATAYPLDAEETAQLRRTRCLVPQDRAESVALYGAGE